VIAALLLNSCLFAQHPAVAGTVTDKQVAVLIRKMLNRRTEHKAFADLEALGCPAVPAIIARMDDRRRLPDPTSVLQNKSKDAFEASRFYGPEKVVDALAAILNQITGQEFGFIYNGGTEAERTSTVSGWHDFLSRTPLSKLRDGAEIGRLSRLIVRWPETAIREVATARKPMLDRTKVMSFCKQPHFS